jgi:hypothetical protein
MWVRMGSDTISPIKYYLCSCFGYCCDTTFYKGATVVAPLLLVFKRIFAKVPKVQVGGDHAV